MTRRRPGFTLLETLAVVAVMALLAGVTVVSVVRPLRRADAASAARLVADQDASARALALADGEPVTLHIDRRAGTWRVGEGRPIALPANVRVVETRPADLRRIEISPAGLTTSYAVRLRGEEDRWVIVAGLTGQVRIAEEVPDAYVP